MKVIKKGKVFRAECECCGALLEYSARDVSEDGTIECPECHNTIPHTRENEYEK